MAVDVSSRGKLFVCLKNSGYGRDEPSALAFTPTRKRDCAAATLIEMRIGQKSPNTFLRSNPIPGSFVLRGSASPKQHHCRLGPICRKLRDSWRASVPIRLQRRAGGG